MPHKDIVFTALLALVIVSFAFGGDKYQLDPAHSSVGFSVKHLVISNTKGQFNDFSGTIVFDEKDISNSSVYVIIRTASIDTDDKKRDNHLRSADFLEVEKHPEIIFRSKRVEKNDDGHLLVGDLTIKGVTKEVSFPFNLVGPITDPWGNKRIGAEAGLTINRQDFGVAWNKALEGGGFLVGNDVKIELQVEGVLAKEGTN